jgi:pyruvate dehydrogenase complex dehydrogenase (E1) component
MRFIEIDKPHVVVAALKSLADEGTVLPELLTRAIERYQAAASWMQ